MNIKIGADPEVFIKNNFGNISAHTMLPGTKEEPFIVPNGAIQVDGVAAEFNIDPASTEDEFLFNIKHVLSILRDMLPEGNEINISPSEVFDLSGLPEGVTNLGCSPDFNAYTLRQNKQPDGKSTSMRTAAGHLHIGWGIGMDVKSQRHFNTCANVAKQLDAYIGLPSILFDDDNKRRELYGKAGAFRPKPYGLEYRTLSNKWLTSDKLIRFVYTNTLSAIKTLMSGKSIAADTLEYIINSGDKHEARKFLSDKKIVWV